MAKDSTKPEAITLSSDGFSHKDIGVFINNAILVASHPAGWGPKGIPERRISDIRSFGQAYLETTVDFINDGSLRPEEAVFAHLAIALMLHVQHVTGKAEMPKGVVSETVLAHIKALLAQQK